MVVASVIVVEVMASDIIEVIGDSTVVSEMMASVVVVGVAIISEVFAANILKSN